MIKVWKDVQSLAKKTKSVSFDGNINIRKIPILPLDNRWHQLFPNNIKPTRIKKLEDEVVSIIKVQSRISKELKDMAKLKKKLMQDIVENMEETDSKKEALRLKRQQTNQKLIIEINEKTEKLTEQNMDIPQQLLEANARLLYASMEECYQKLAENEKDIEKLAQWIDRTREELKQNLVIKQEKEEQNQNIYSYMHDILGADYMEVFDKNHS